MDDNSTLLLGIDIGWSEKQRSCAFAACDPKQAISWPQRSDNYGSTGIKCCRFRLSEVIAFLDSVRLAMANYNQTIVVLDGPLGPHAKPILNRPVDSSFRRGQFYKRMQPADIDNEIGRTYVDATYQVAEGFGFPFSPWVGGTADSKFLVTETNPTVGLALMNRKYAIEEIPSRKRPLMPPVGQSNERAIRAKSDFYWRAGGNELCSIILGSPKIESERNHENVAGLYCLAVAFALNSGTAVSCGDQQSGVYVFPSFIHEEWHADLAKVGIVSGNLQAAIQPTHQTNFADWGSAILASAHNAKSPGTLQHGDEAGEDLLVENNHNILLLNDNGGIWERHNDWLEGVTGPVRARCMSGKTEVQLERAKSTTQWKIDPKALPLAKLYGFDRPHLSGDHCIAIEIEILDVAL